MKISNSKRRLAKIIHGNGGWLYGEFAVQNGNHGRISFSNNKPTRYCATGWDACGGFAAKIECCKPLPNWHQNILSRDEYFHLYPAQDADGWIEWKGGECPVERGAIVDIKFRGGATYEMGLGADKLNWAHEGVGLDVIAYRLRKPESTIEKLCAVVTDHNKHEADPTIEQLAAEYRNLRDIAERKQKDADSAKAEADAKLGELERAGKALGLIIGIVKDDQVKSELNITDWRDLQVGDVVEGRHYSRAIIGEVIEIDEDCHDNRPLRILEDGGQPWWVTSNEVKFIRRP